MADISPGNWSYATAAHLLLRSGFGHNGRYNKTTGEVSQIRHFANLTPQAAVNELLNIRTSKLKGPGTLDGGDVDFAKLQLWWITRMIRTTNPLAEKMVLFLHTHFATARSKVTKPLYMAAQNALFRQFALGSFRELVKQATVDAAMLWWLDGNLNKIGRPNENYARELQELFTLGVFDFNGQSNYTQKDVTEGRPDPHRLALQRGQEEDRRRVPTHPPRRGREDHLRKHAQSDRRAGQLQPTRGRIHVFHRSNLRHAPRLR